MPEIARSKSVGALGGSWRRAAIVAVIVVLAVFALGVWRVCRPSAAQALQDFYVYGDEPSGGVAEDMLMDPLILAGERVVPLVIEALSNRQMPRRRYAIGFLGNGAYTTALPALRRVLAAETEDPLFRGDALLAICEIDGNEGLKKAPAFASRADYLGSTAKSLIASGCETKRRSYADAWWGRHD